MKAKNEEIFSLREKNRKKDIQIVLLKDSVKKTELKEGSPSGYIERNDPPTRSSTHSPNTGSPRTIAPQVRTNQQPKSQLRTVLPVNSGQINQIVNGNQIINSNGQIVRKVQNVSNLNQLKIPAGSKLIQVGNQKIVTKFPTVTNGTQYANVAGFNQPVRMVRFNL